MTEKFDGTPHQVKVITPEGEAQWASLKTPKQWKNEDKMNYIVHIILPQADAAPIIDICNSVIESIVADMPKNVKMSPHNPYKTEEDGRVSLKFKRPHFAANDRYPATPPIKTYLPDGSRVNWDETDWSVGNGSRIQIGGFVRPYFVPMLGLGISLRLDAVKVLELKKYTEGEGGNDFAEFATAIEAGSETAVTGEDF